MTAGAVRSDVGAEHAANSVKASCLIHADMVESVSIKLSAVALFCCTFSSSSDVRRPLRMASREDSKV